LNLSVYAPDSEDLCDPDSETVTISVTHVNGSIIVPAGTPVTRVDEGEYAFMLPTQPLSKLIVVWSYMISGFPASNTDYVDVISSHYVSLEEIRAMDAMNSTQGGGLMYSTDTLIGCRDDAEALFEQVLGRYYTPTYCIDILDGDPNYRRALQSAVMNVIDYIPMRRLILSHEGATKLLALSLDGQKVISPQRIGTVTAATALTFSDTAAVRYPGEDGGKLVTFTNPDAPAGYITASINTNNILTPGVIWQLGPVNMGLTAYQNPDGTDADYSLAVGMPYSMDSDLSNQYVVYPSGELEAQLGTQAFPRGIGNVQAEYVAGYTSMASDLRRALKKYIRYLILQSNSRNFERSTTITSEGNT
jgi:hypothetical protein